MTVKERILATVERANGPVCDDCMVKLAELTARQVSYQVCENLAAEGTIGRGNHRSCIICGKIKITNWSPNAGNATSPKPAKVKKEEPASKSVNGTKPWYWEGNVQAALAAHLLSEGYSIRSVADTESRAPGKDIIAISPEGRELWVSVKGFPESSPNTQARHWFSGAIFDLILYHGENPDVTPALGLPDGFPTYKGLVPRVKWLQESMPFKIYWVEESGRVTVG
ncbi:MAG: hypothetical protein JL50_00885 [Peptococcaceae bacterium BICA1-7]|nr:MAG: hypothetical protein JL50_00885 [Peptococcaceae bacterium BICA1-7]HBV98055.1 hypothetical protein [Desulfotomaculum sp.]